MLCVLVSDIKGCLEFRPGIATLFYVNECHLLVVVSAVATCISQQFPDLKIPSSSPNIMFMAKSNTGGKSINSTPGSINRSVYSDSQ